MNKLYKYPRTYHFDWSPGTTSDDRILHDIDSFTKMKEVVVSEKLDGENTTLYNDATHARSLDSRHHPSRNWVKGLWGSIQYYIEEDMRICGENLFAKHSIFYDNLPSYFLVFGIYQGEFCLSWDDTVEICELLGLTMVPVLYRGPWDLEAIKACYTGTSQFGGEQEGYVVRNADGFGITNFKTNCAKMVRAKHVNTSDFWMTQAVVPNKLQR